MLLIKLRCVTPLYALFCIEQIICNIQAPNLPHSKQNVQECDASKVAHRYAEGNIIKKTVITPSNLLNGQETYLGSFFQHVFISGIILIRNNAVEDRFADRIFNNTYFFPGR